MVSEWYQAESKERPGEWDTQTSPAVVYQRKDIKETERTNEQEGAITEKTYTYQERTMTKEEYAAYQAELESPATKMIMQSLSALEMRQATMEEMMEG